MAARIKEVLIVVAPLPLIGLGWLVFSLVSEHKKETAAREVCRLVADTISLDLSPSGEVTKLDDIPHVRRYLLLSEQAEYRLRQLGAIHANEELYDGWVNRLRIAESDEGICVRSAGRDGVMDSVDDIVEWRLEAAPGGR